MKTGGNTNTIWRGEHLKVQILFTRAGLAQQIWVENESGALLFDTGDGTLRDIIDSGLDLKKLKALFYTHGHFDHMGGLHSLLGFLRMVGRKEPLPVNAPEGCTEVFSAVVNFKRCYPESIPFKLPCLELQDHEKIDTADMTVEAWPVIHYGSVENGVIQDQIPAMGYRISCRGETVAISGDSGLCDSLRELVKGVDLAVIEATAEKKTDLSEAMLEKVHLAEDVAAELGRSAKEFILVHKGKR